MASHCFMSAIWSTNCVWQAWITPYTPTLLPTTPQTWSAATLDIGTRSLNHSPHQWCSCGSTDPSFVLQQGFPSHHSLFHPSLNFPVYAMVWWGNQGSPSHLFSFCLSPDVSPSDTRTQIVHAVASQLRVGWVNFASPISVGLCYLDDSIVIYLFDLGYRQHKLQVVLFILRISIGPYTRELVLATSSWWLLRISLAFICSMTSPSLLKSLPLICQWGVLLQLSCLVCAWTLWDLGLMPRSCVTPTFFSTPSTLTPMLLSNPLYQHMSLACILHFHCMDLTTMVDAPWPSFTWPKRRTKLN